MIAIMADQTIDQFFTSDLFDKMCCIRLIFRCLIQKNQFIPIDLYDRRGFTFKCSKTRRLRHIENTDKGKRTRENTLIEHIAPNYRIKTCFFFDWLLESRLCAFCFFTYVITSLHVKRMSKRTKDDQT